jgi:hypothetical protein
MDRVTVIEYNLDTKPEQMPTVWSNTHTSLNVLTYYTNDKHYSQRYKVGYIKQHTSNLKTKGYTVIVGSQFWSHVIIVAEKHPMFNVNLVRHNNMGDIELTPKSGLYEVINNWSQEVCLAADK